MGFEKDKASSSSYVLNVPREDTPLVAPNGYHLSSHSKTFANVFIAIVGVGVLGLPYIFKRTGWAIGVLMLSSVAFLTYHYMMLLVHTQRRLESSLKSPKIKDIILRPILGRDY